MRFSRCTSNRVAHKSSKSAAWVWGQGLQAARPIIAHVAGDCISRTRQRSSLQLHPDLMVGTAVAVLAAFFAGVAVGWVARTYYVAYNQRQQPPRGGGVGSGEMIGATLLNDHGST